MKKLTLLLFISLFFLNLSTAQNQSIKLLVEKANGLNLDIFELTDFAKSNIKDKRELAKFFYYWIGENIDYDDDFFNRKIRGNITHDEYLKTQNHYEVFDSKKAICAGYANLYEWFMFEVEIEVEIISGHIRDERNHYVDLSSTEFLHGWNAIKIDNKWLLVDSTWGATNDLSQSEFYFDIKPEWAILTHFPKDEKWQLLENPLSLEEFNKSKFVNQLWFYAGFTDIPRLMQDEDFYYFIFETNPDKSWIVDLLHSNDNSMFSTIKNVEIINQDGNTYYRFSKDQIKNEAYFKVNLRLLERDDEAGGYLFSNYSDIINFKIE